MSKYSAFRNPHSAIGKSCMMKNLASGLKYSAFRNPHSEIGNRGFTLIEIIVMIVMAGILLPVIVVPFVTGVRGSGKPEMVTKAMYLGHQRMEELMKFDYGIGTTNFAVYAPIDAINFPNYDWQWEVLYVPNTDLNAAGQLNPDTGYKRILVRVRDPQLDTYVVYSVVTNFP